MRAKQSRVHVPIYKIIVVPESRQLSTAERKAIYAHEYIKGAALIIDTLYTVRETSSFSATIINRRPWHVTMARTSWLYCREFSAQ